MVIRLRKVDEKDLSLIYNWTNEKSTRLVSFNTGEISLEEHSKWFNTMLKSKEVVFLVAEDSETNLPVGQIRINDMGTVSICIGEEFRGRKYAPDIIKESINFIKYSVETLHIDCMYAYIKEDNLPSINSFKRAGFLCLGLTDFSGHECLKFAYNLN